MTLSPSLYFIADTMHYSILESSYIHYPSLSAMLSLPILPINPHLLLFSFLDKFIIIIVIQVPIIIIIIIIKMITIIMIIVIVIIMIMIIIIIIVIIIIFLTLILNVFILNDNFSTLRQVHGSRDGYNANSKQQGQSRVL